MNRAERRHVKFTHAIWKQKMDRQIHNSSWYDNLHQYADNKIHCSCPMCRCKTRDPKKKDLWPVSDIRKQNDMQDLVAELFGVKFCG